MEGGRVKEERERGETEVDGKHKSVERVGNGGRQRILQEGEVRKWGVRTGGGREGVRVQI